MIAHDSPPHWAREAIFYQIFPDRFARSETQTTSLNLEPWSSRPTDQGFKGGDLLGIVEKIDYLVDLGINALYLNPVFQSTCNHRYHTHDYYRVDPLLGGDEALRLLIREAHRRQIRIILDGVFNHASRGFYQFNDILENGPSSPWLDWFVVEAWPLAPYDGSKPANYASWWNNRALPKFNTDNPQVQAFLLDVAEYWIREFDIDGWRLDVPEEIKTPGFWEAFRKRVKGARADAYIVGEIWDEASEWLRGDRFDAVMNYPLAADIIAFCLGQRVNPRLLEGRAYAPHPPISAVQFGERIERQLNLYDWEVTLAQLNVLGSHDTARLIALAGGDAAAVKLAVLLQMTLPGAPCVYYGDEIGLAGGESADGSYEDKDARRTFPWHDRGLWDDQLLDHFKAMIALRREHTCLKQGVFRQLAAIDDCYAFIRVADRDAIIVVVNAGDEPLDLELALEETMTDGRRPTSLLDGRTVGALSDSTLKLSAPPNDGLVIGLSRDL